MPCAVGPGFGLSLDAIGTNVIDAFGSGLPSSVTRPLTFATFGPAGPQPTTIVTSRMETTNRFIPRSMERKDAETQRRREKGIDYLTVLSSLRLSALAPFR